MEPAMILINVMQNCRGNASRTTKIDPPVDIVYTEKFETFVEARRREVQLKRWSRAKKEALLSEDMDKLHLLAKSKKR